MCLSRESEICLLRLEHKLPKSATGNSWDEVRRPEESMGATS